MTDQQPTDPSGMYTNSIPPPPVINPAGTTLTKNRPVAVTVIGILLLVYAGIELLSTPSTIMQLLGNVDPSLGLTTGFLIYSLCVGLLGIILDLVIGIGLIKVLAWARKGAIVWMILRCLLGIASTLIMMSNMSMNIPEASPMGQDIFDIIMKASIGFGVVVSLVINGLFIFFLTRPNVVKVFQEAGE